MANISAIKLPNGTTYDLKDNGALQLTGGQVTGPVTFGDSISVDEATIGDLVVNGNASFTNNIQANTINGVAVGSSPKFTDTNTEVSTLTLASGSTAGTSLAYGGKYTLTAGSKTVSFTMPASDNTDEKLKTTETTATTGYLIFGGSSSAAGTKNFSYSYKINVNEDDGEAVLEVGRVTSVDGGLGLYNTNSGLSFLWANSAGSGAHIYLPSQPGTLALTSDIPTVPSNIVNTITTTAGAHTAITSQKGNVSFNVPTTAAHVGIKFGYTTSGNNRAVLQDGSGNLYVTQKDDDSDTKNTAGSTDSSSKLFLIGATSQAANPQTYSHDTAYVGTDGCLYSGSQKTLVEYYGDGSSATRIQITPTIDVSNNYARFIIGASDGTNMMQLSIEGNNVNIFDVAHEKTYFAVYGATSLYDDKVHITNVHTPTYDSDAANKKYVDDKRTQTTATLTTTWTSNQQTVTVSGVTTSNTVVVTPAPTSYEAYCEAGIYCSAQAANSLTFKCSTVPTSSLTVNIMILK